MYYSVSGIKDCSNDWRCSCTEIIRTVPSFVWEYPAVSPCSQSLALSSSSCWIVSSKFRDDDEFGGESPLSKRALLMKLHVVPTAVIGSVSVRTDFPVAYLVDLYGIGRERAELRMLVLT
jgi:hypothetical protein